MNPTLIVQELVIIIAVKNHKPTILNPDFLKYSGIVPSEWELARSPVSTSSVAQVTYQNGISIVAEPQRVMFLEALADKAAASVLVPGVTSKYVQTLPNVDYQAVGINFRGYVPFDSQPDAARKYLAETLLSPGPWHEIGTAPVRTTLNYAYTLERGQFNLSVNEAGLQQPDETTTPIVLFSGNFNYGITGNTGSDRLASLEQAISNWQLELKTYEDIVNTKFLVKVADNKVVVPDLFAMTPGAA